VSDQKDSDAHDGLFTCPNHIGELRITPATCASMWLRARREAKESWHRLAPCVGCQIGAANAGASAPARPSPTVSGPSCVRCGQGGRRLVLGKSLCVSCFNRQREYRAGRNAKGGPTRDHMPLFCAVLGVVGEAGAVQPMRVEWVSSWVEARLIVARRAGARQARAVILPPVMHGQIGLFWSVPSAAKPVIAVAAGRHVRRPRVAAGQLRLPGVGP